jgi:hypothetical protein
MQRPFHVANHRNSVQYFLLRVPGYRHGPENIMLGSDPVSFQISA